MKNAEEIFHLLEDFSKRKPKIIPQQLNEYLAYVARTGDPVYQWSLVKSLFKEKLLSVITDFDEITPGIDIPPYPNVDPLYYVIMKNSLLERLDSFTSTPVTVKRFCELLTFPRKHYNRVDKFMRAIEKNILVVSTREASIQRHAKPENGEPVKPIVNIDMEDMSWKENAEQPQISEPQPGSSDTHISADDIEARLKAKQETPMNTQDKIANQYESVTPPELNICIDEPPEEIKASAEPNPQASVSIEEPKVEATTSSSPKADPKVDIEMKLEVTTPKFIIPIIIVEDAEMTEQRLRAQSSLERVAEATSESASEKEAPNTEPKPVTEPQSVTTSSSPKADPKVDVEMKPEFPTPTFIIPEIIVEDAEMTEQRLRAQSSLERVAEDTSKSASEKEAPNTEPKPVTEPQSVTTSSSPKADPKVDIEMKLEVTTPKFIIPIIIVEDAEMTEQRLRAQSSLERVAEATSESASEKEAPNTEPKPVTEPQSVTTSSSPKADPKVDVEMKPEFPTPTFIIPEIIVEDAEMTEQRLRAQSSLERVAEDTSKSASEKEAPNTEPKPVTEPQSVTTSSSPKADPKVDIEMKLEVTTPKFIIPIIIVEDAEMTEQRLRAQSSLERVAEATSESASEKEAPNTEPKPVTEPQSVTTSSSPKADPKVDVEMKPEFPTPTFIIPEIIVEDAEMTEQRLRAQSSLERVAEDTSKSASEKEAPNTEPKPVTEPQSVTTSSSPKADPKVDIEMKLEVTTPKFIIPIIIVEDAEMTEQRLRAQSSLERVAEATSESASEKEAPNTEPKPVTEPKSVTTSSSPKADPKVEFEMKLEVTTRKFIIPIIIVEDAEMTEQRLRAQSSLERVAEATSESASEKGAPNKTCDRT